MEFSVSPWGKLISDSKKLESNLQPSDYQNTVTYNAITSGHSRENMEYE